MDKITIIILIIIILICCSLLIVTGYISFKVYTKPTHTETEQQPYVQSIMTPVEQIQPKQEISRTIVPNEVQEPILTKRDIPEYTIDPGSLSITLPKPEELLQQVQASNKIEPIPFNVSSRTNVSQEVSSRQMARRLLTNPPNNSSSSVRRI